MRPAEPHPNDACPLCGAPLRDDQDWCLRCGAAARTRLAPTPHWRTPIALAIVILLLSAGVVSAALVRLAGGSGTTTIFTTAPAGNVATPAPTTTALSTSPVTSTGAPPSAP